MANVQVFHICLPIEDNEGQVIETDKRGGGAVCNGARGRGRVRPAAPRPAC